jgi:hypothetical protein
MGKHRPQNKGSRAERPFQATFVPQIDLLGSYEALDPGIVPGPARPRPKSVVFAEAPPPAAAGHVHVPQTAGRWTTEIESSA